MRTGRTISRPRALIDVDRALGKPDIAVDCGHDFGDRNRRSVARKTISAAGTSECCDQSRVRQCLEDLGDRGLWQPSFGRDRDGIDPPIGKRGEMSGDDDAVIREPA